MKIIGVIGLPGSGKSTLFAEPQFNTFQKIDDIGKNWSHNETLIRDSINNGKSVVVSDIEFCRTNVRMDFEARIGIPIEWICFENAPFKCATNSTHRHFFIKPERNPVEELFKIIDLSKVYQPFGKIRPVVVSENVVKHLM